MVGKKSEELRNIAELRYSNTGSGWKVRFHLSRWVQANFFDSQYGGHAEALAMAKRFRDAIERELEPRRYKAGIYMGQLTRRNKTGVVGVSRSDRPYMRRGRQYRNLHWIADLLLINGRRKKKRFSIPRHGEEKARQFAIQARLEAEHEFNMRHFTTFRPPSDELRMWRYMDFTKFVSMLENEGLFFARSTGMDDAFEGGYSRGNEELRGLVYKALGPFKHDKKSIEQRRRETVLSCWHGSHHESAAMWKLYSNSNESICVQTTFGRLRSHLPLNIEIGRVQYIDFETEWVPERHPILPFLYKRKSFEHEHEFRAVLNVNDQQAKTAFPIKPKENGLWIKCDLRSLIENVYVAPNVSRWFFDLVKQIVARYRFEFPVVQSSLDAKPNYGRATSIPS